MTQRMYLTSVVWSETPSAPQLARCAVGSMKWRVHLSLTLIDRFRSELYLGFQAPPLLVVYLGIFRPEVLRTMWPGMGLEEVCLFSQKLLLEGSLV